MAKALQNRLRRQLGEGMGLQGKDARAVVAGMSSGSAAAAATASTTTAAVSAEVREHLEVIRQHHRARVLQLKQRLSELNAGAAGAGGPAAAGSEAASKDLPAARREAIRRAREAHREHVRELRAEARRQHEARAREIEARKLERERLMHSAPSWAIPAGAASATTSFSATAAPSSAAISAAALQRMQIRRAPHMWMEGAAAEGGAVEEEREWMRGTVKSAAEGVKGLKSLVEALQEEDPRALYADMIRYRIRQQAGSAGVMAMNVPGPAPATLPRRLAPKMNASQVPWIPATRRGDLPLERDPAALRASAAAAVHLRPSRPTPIPRHDPRTELFASLTSRMPAVPLPPRAQPAFRSKHNAAPSFVVRPRRSCRCGAGSRWKPSA
jgi:hypothetical protein